MKPGIALAALVFFASSSLATTVDNCATVLGSISVELRLARALPASRRSTFICPKERQTRPLIGAERQRLLNSLGPPDAVASPADDSGHVQWSYYFGSAAARAGSSGFTELVFSLDEQRQVVAVDCRLTSQAGQSPAL